MIKLILMIRMQTIIMMKILAREKLVQENEESIFERSLIYIHTRLISIFDVSLVQYMHYQVLVTLCTLAGWGDCSGISFV